MSSIVPTRFLSRTTRLAERFAPWAPVAMLAALAVGDVSAALPPGVATTGGDLAHRELRHRVQCPLPKTTPCSIRKPVLSGYHLLSDQVALDDHGEYWLADFSRTGKKPGDPPPVRVLADNGVLHLIEIVFAATDGKIGAAAKPATARKAAGKTKAVDGGEGAKVAAKAVESVNKEVGACIEKCRQVAK